MNNENTIYDSNKAFGKSQSGESTIYDNASTQRRPSGSESTAYDDQFVGGGNKPEAPKPTPTIKNGGKSWKRNAAVAFGAAAVSGGAVALFTSGKAPDVHTDAPVDEHSEWVDGNVPVAHNVSDDMSFQDAFDSARLEVGAGGVFEWHGYIYSTYTADEWNSMSQAERDDYASHFNWQGDIPESAQTGASQASDDVAVVSASPSHTATPQGEGPDYAATAGTHEAEEVVITDDDLMADTSSDDDMDVQVLGVQHDDENNVNVATAVVDGNDALLVDIDNDNVFDVIAIDSNHDSSFSDEEMFDISSQNITVGDAAMAVNPTDGLATDATADGSVASVDDSADFTGSADGSMDDAAYTDMTPSV